VCVENENEGVVTPMMDQLLANPRVCLEGE